jgi:hypothetical protein
MKDCIKKSERILEPNLGQVSAMNRMYGIKDKFGFRVWKWFFGR